MCGEGYQDGESAKSERLRDRALEKAVGLKGMKSATQYD